MSLIPVLFLPEAEKFFDSFDHEVVRVDLREGRKMG